MHRRPSRQLRSAAVAACLLASVMAATSPAGADDATPTDATVTLVVRSAGATATQIVSAADAVTEVGNASSVSQIATTTVEVPAADAAAASQRINQLNGVSSVSVDQPVSVDMVPNDPAYPSQWGLAATGAPNAWDTSTGSSSTIIAVVDTGVTVSPDLAGRVLPGRDFVNNDFDASDDHGHGSEVATVAAARGNDASGIAGLCWQCRILPVKVLDSTGSGYMSNVAFGIVWATDNGAKVINLSLGGPTNLQALTDAVNYAAAHDVLVVAAAGNDGSSNPTYPAATPAAMAVAGSTSSGGLYTWSQRGSSWVDVAAPGCNKATGRGVLSDFCGTSSATPFTAGLAGLLRSERPDLSADAIRSALESTTQTLNVAGASAHGIVSAVASMASLVSPAPPQSAAPDTAAPSVGVDPSGGYLSGVTQAIVHVSDDQGLGAVAIEVGGRLVARADLAGPAATLSLPWDTRAFGDGGTVLTAVVADAAGNTSTAETWVVIDNATPTASMSGPNGATVTGPFTVRAAAADGNGIRAMLVAANGQWLAISLGGGPINVTVPVNSSGPIRVAAAAIDNAGRLSFSNVVVVIGKVSKAKAVRHRR